MELAKPLRLSGKCVAMIFRVRRKGHGFAHAQRDAHDEQGGEAVEQPGDGGGRGPQKKAANEDPFHVKAIHQPSSEELTSRVGPEESR